MAIVQRREWKALLAPLLAPVGWISFQLFLAHQTGERDAWFRVQGEAWDEGTSFGLTAIRDIGNALVHPLDSPRNVLTLLCIAAMLFGLWATWKRPLPLPVTVYTIGILALMLLPQTVTARPAVPLHRVPAPDLRRRGLAGQGRRDVAAAPRGLRGRPRGRDRALRRARRHPLTGRQLGPQRLDGAREALPQVDPRRPPQQLARPGDVGAAASRVTRAPGGQRHRDDG